LRKSYIDLLKQMASIYTAGADFQPAIDCLCALLRAEPTDESGQRDLMKLYAQTGERHKALRLYQRSSEILRAELGVEPSGETTAVYEAILEETLPPMFDALPLVTAAGEHRDPAEEAGPVPLVGRRAEKHALVEYLHQAQRGRGDVIFLIGEQGVGKTRMGQELASYARAARVKILQGAAFEGEGQLLYAPFVGAIRHGLTPQTLGQIRQRLGPLTNDLARLLPELARSIASKHTRHEPAISGLDIETGDQERRRLFDAIAATLATLAHNGSLLVILDNLHAAGESSLQLLHYLARQITHQRILFVCMVDQDKLQRGAPLTLTLGELQRNHLAKRLNLRRLDPDEVTQLCAHILDSSVRSSNIPAIVHDLTEGNPFFVRELVFALTKTGKIERRDGVWQLLPEALSVVPSSVQEIIGIRLGQLSNDAYRLLGMAAVIGNGLSIEALQAATAWERGRLLDAFDELRGEALIEPAEAGYRFQHAMIRQAVYNELSAERRAWLHEQVATALEALVAHQLDEQANVLAYHYERAGDYAAAVRYLIRAGDWARRAYALRESLEHYNRALALCRQHSVAADMNMAINLLERRSQTYLALSNFDSAISDLEQLLNIYQDSGQQMLAGATLYRIGFSHYWAHRLMKATMYLDQALDLAETLDYSDLRNRALRLRDILNSTQGSIADSAAADMPDDTKQPYRMQAEELWGYAMLAHLRYDFETALHRAQSCIVVGEATSNTFLWLGGSFILGMSQASLGDYQASLDSLLGALKLSEATGDRFWRARLLNTIGWIYRDLFSLELARESTPRLTEAEGNALANLATTYWLLGQYDQSRAYLNEGLALSANEPFMRWRYYTRLVIVQGRLALIDGDLDAAWNATERSLDLARNTKARKNIARSCLLRGKVLLAQGEFDRARAAMRHALSVAHDLQAVGLTWTCDLALAELEQADRRPDAAQAHYRAALEIIERIAGRLTSPALRERFLDAEPVRQALAQGQALASI
jgi:tetratricopeptide (TPR) repeat protein